MEEARNHATSLDKISVEEVNRAAAAVFEPKNANCVGCVPRSADPAKGN